jgi:hypothetical protein
MLPVDDRKSFARRREELDARESSVEGRACTYAKKLGYWHRKFKSPGKTSAPDRLFCNQFGFMFFIEFKALGKGPTVLQASEHEEMRRYRMNVYVIDNYADACQLLEAHSLT